MVELALGLGIALNLLFTEVLGLTSGGLVVPGYLALHLSQPARLLATIAVGGATFAAVRYGWMRLAVLYGRRRFGVTILTGFVLHGLYTLVLSSAPAPADLRVVGYIVPGLIANWFERQGFWKTLSTMTIAAVLVRLMLMVVFGGEV